MLQNTHDKNSNLFSVVNSYFIASVSAKHIYVSTCILVRIYEYLHMYIYTYVYIYIYMYICKPDQLFCRSLLPWIVLFWCVTGMQGGGPFLRPYTCTNTWWTGSCKTRTAIYFRHYTATLWHQSLPNTYMYLHVCIYMRIYIDMYMCMYLHICIYAGLLKSLQDKDSNLLSAL